MLAILWIRSRRSRTGFASAAHTYSGQVMKHRLWLLVLALFIASCAPTLRIDPRAGFKGRIDSLPEAWRDEPVVILEDSVLFALIPGKETNRVERREVRWYYVNRRHPNTLEHIQRPDFENLEDPVELEASAFFPDGTQWKMGPGEARRGRSNDGEYPSTNRFLTVFTLPAYPEGALIRIRETRRYHRPEFPKSEMLRSEYPCLSKSLAIATPPGADIRLGLLNPEGLPLDTSGRSDATGSRFSVSASRLEKLDGRTMPRDPETWYAALHFSLPPRGLRSYSWKELGDAYLASIKASAAVTPEIEALAATVRDKDPDTIATRFLAILRARIRYHADMDKLHAFVPRPAAQVLSKGYGDCKEMSTLMAVLVNHAEKGKGGGGTGGARVGMALVSPPGYLQVLEEYPTLGGFNHMVVYLAVPGKPLRFFDPTVNHGDPNDSYFPVIDRTALVLEAGNSRLVRIEAAKDFRNRIETRSSILPERSGKEWRLEGRIRLDGLAAFQLFPALESIRGDGNIPFLKKYLRDAFGVQATACKASSDPDRTVISIEYQAPFTANYLDLDKGGLLVNQPSLYGGEARYTTLDFEGPRHFTQVEQNDAWQLPPGFAEVKADPLEHSLGKGAWKREGSTLKRSYVSRAAHIAQGQRSTAADFSQRKAKFARATLWR